MTNSVTAAGKNQRVVYFDILRILAISFVMVLHVSSANWYQIDINSFEWRMMNLYDSISRWSVPVLVMISGALFLSRDITIKKFYKNYILRIVLAFIAWSFAYSFYFDMIGGKGFYSFVTSFLQGPYHMWFLFMIVGLYMITPFLKKIVSDKRLTKYFLALAVIFAIIVPEAINILKVFSSHYGDLVAAVVHSAHLKFVLGYTVYYILGFLLSNITLSKKLKVCIYIFGIIGFISTALLTETVSKRLNTKIDFFYDNFTVNVFFEAVFVFVFVKGIMEKHRFSEKTVMLISALSKYSFGAYLVHVLIITLLGELFNLHSLSFNSAFSIPFVSVIVFIISFAISAILNHVPIVKKYLV